MYLHLSDKTESAILRCIAQQPCLTARQICGLLAQRRCVANRSSVYERLRRLQNVGVVVKVNGGFAVERSWASALASFANDVRSTCLEHAAASGIIVAPGDRKVWRFRTLRSLCEFWLHLYLALGTKSQDNRFLDWSPFLLLDLACKYYASRGGQMRTALRYLGGHGLRIYDDMHPLNRMLIGQSDGLPFTAASAESPYHRHERRIINVLGDYLVTVDLDDRAMFVLAERFSNTQLPSHFALARTLDRRVNVRLCVEHNCQKAQSHRRRFGAYFGIRI